MDSKLSHLSLCKITAERFIKKSIIALYEYQSYATSEFPDVLIFDNNARSTVFEIKVDKQDFKRDSAKECRIKYRMKYFPRFFNYPDSNKIKKYLMGRPELTELISEFPHMGMQRFYVCPADIIEPNEVTNGWGLYWYRKDRFYIKKKSEIFKRNLYEEQRIIVHAFRKYANSEKNNILIKPYK